MDRVGGMAYVDGQLIVNTYEYYDAPGDNTVSTCVIWAWLLPALVLVLRRRRAGG